MFYIVKSNHTEKCKVVHFLEDENPQLNIITRTSTIENKKFYRIQYKKYFWFMGYCTANIDSKYYVGENDMFKTLEFESFYACELFLKMFNKELKTFKQKRNKATEVNI